MKESTKQLISERLKEYFKNNPKRTLTDEQKKHLSEINKGKIISEETRLLLSEKLTLYHQNTPHRVLTDEQKKHLSDINKGKILSEETKEKMSNSKSGSNNKSAKINEEDVLEIRRLSETNEMSKKEIAIKFNISYETTCKIVKRTLWKHI